MLRIETRSADGGVPGATFVIWTIDRPKAKNALDLETLAQLRAAVEDARANARTSGVRAIVLTGAGDSFVSGGDLRELRDKNSAADAEAFAEAGSCVCAGIESLEVPVIAALPGPAIGGGAELAVACDLRIADRRTRLSFKQVRMGVTTGWGSGPRLVALCGRSTGARLLFTGQEVSSDAALALGLVDAVVDDGQCVTSALAWGREIAEGSPRAVAETKRLLRAELPDLPSRIAAERLAFVKTWSGPDHVEAMNAFFEKRKPVWA